MNPKLFLLAIVGALIEGGAAAAEPPAVSAKPNIVYILADDLGYDDVGCYNPNSKIPTPNLDRLANEGIRFTDAHAPDAVCTPTRYGVLTGRYCFRSSLKGGVLGPWGDTLIAEGRLTVPMMLKQHGYDRIRRYGHYSMGGLRGVKRDAWEGGHRVAFLARWPGHTPSGAVSDETICHVDLMGTAAAIVGARFPENAGEVSYNILPVLLGEKRTRPIREATVLHSSIAGKLAIRQSDWVLIDAPTGEANGRRGEPEWFKQERGYQSDAFPGELYNLREDLAERHNYYGEKPEIVARLKTLLEQYKTNGRSTPGAPQSDDPPAQPQKKKARANAVKTE